ncbi:Mce protein [Mycobacterium seoulense]|uniref:Mce protein n=1 Tax=Mycobacterium seoulense TaxID=386911 RepID=UPI003CE69F44
MAKDTEERETADAAEELSEATADGDRDIDDAGQPTEAGETAEDTAGLANRLARLRRRATPRLSHTGRALVAGVVVVAALVGLTGWLGYRTYQQHEAQAQRDLFVQVARQGAVNLTTINYTEVDTDVQRILDLATGAFREDFEQRSKPFIEVVKAAQSKSEGTVTDAGLESRRGDSAQVLVAVAVKSRTAGGEEAPREWRMRIEVRSVGDDAKVSNVVFVP